MKEGTVDALKALGHLLFWGTLIVLEFTHGGGGWAGLFVDNGPAFYVR